MTCAKRAAEFAVATLAEQEHVQIAERRAERIGIFGDALATAGEDAQAVGNAARQHAQPESGGMDPLQCGQRLPAVACDHLYRGRVWNERADSATAIDLVRAEHRERIAMSCLDDGINGALNRQSLHDRESLHATTWPRWESPFTRVRTVPRSSAAMPRTALRSSSAPARRPSGHSLSRRPMTVTKLA
jgi:hypothetical protein